VKVVQVIFAVTSSEYVNSVVVTICSVHVARARRDSLSLEIYPSIILKI
jgi:hypothetical protein